MFDLDTRYEYELDNLMHNRRDEALNKLKKVVCSQYVEEFAKILHYSWQENLPEADSILQSIDFYPIDFMALSFNREEFESLLLKESSEIYD